MNVRRQRYLPGLLRIGKNVQAVGEGDDGVSAFAGGGHAREDAVRQLHLLAGRYVTAHEGVPATPLTLPPPRGGGGGRGGGAHKQDPPPAPPRPPAGRRAPPE